MKKHLQEITSAANLFSKHKESMGTRFHSCRDFDVFNIQIEAKNSQNLFRMELLETSFCQGKISKSGHFSTIT
jgi:hypothetical protein